MKKLFLMLIIMLVAVGLFANGQIERAQDGTRLMTQQQLQECYVDGEFDVDLFMENSPIVNQLDTDGDGIVDGTSTSVEDFILARIDSIPMQRQGMMDNRRNNKQPRGRGRS